jgi:hypothetical protein
VTVKVSAASAEGTAAAGAEPAAGADLAAGPDLAAGADPVAGGAAEHPGSTAAIHTHAAQMTGPFLSIWRGLAWLEHPMAAGWSGPVTGAPGSSARRTAANAFDFEHALSARLGA